MEERRTYIIAGAIATTLVIIGFVFGSYTGMNITLSDIGTIAQIQDPARVEDFEPVLDFSKPLAKPPSIIKAIYFTASSAGNEKNIEYLLALAKDTEINTVVIDIKDFSGYVAYDTDVPEAAEYKAERIAIPDVRALVARLHQEGIYVIARITVFQDPVLARARPDLAVKNSAGGIWRDRNGLAWIDPAAQDAWAYTVAIAQDALGKGFDELNFDYIRFPSDGDLSSARYPFWKRQTSKHEVLREFFSKLREGLSHTKLSADLFGFVTSHKDDLGVGQIIEDAFVYFDYVSPMVYPSHYPKGFLGYENPAAHPYEVVKHQMDSAAKRLAEFHAQNINGHTSALRPLLQDFDLGADYSASKIQAQIHATQDALGDTFQGFMLWNARNIYTQEALVP